MNIDLYLTAGVDIDTEQLRKQPSVRDLVIACRREIRDGRDVTDACEKLLDVVEGMAQEHGDMLSAINGVAPWLSASLSSESCSEYDKACQAIFECDQS